MDDEQILERGGTQEDINQYARQNGADLTKEDVEMDSLQTKIKEVLPKEKKGYFPSHDNTDHYLQGYNQALSDVHSSIPKIIEIIRKEIPLYRSGVLESGETQEFRNGRNAGLKEVREIIK